MWIYDFVTGKKLESSICLTISKGNSVPKKGGESDELSTCKDNRIEIEDEVESKPQSSDEVTGTNKFSVKKTLRFLKILGIS